MGVCAKNAMAVHSKQLQDLEVAKRANNAPQGKSALTAGERAKVHADRVPPARSRHQQASLDAWLLEIATVSIHLSQWNLLPRVTANVLP